jgi:hypothetical protein
MTHQFFGVHVRGVHRVELFILLPMNHRSEVEDMDTV